MPLVILGRQKQSQLIRGWPMSVMVRLIGWVELFAYSIEYKPSLQSCDVAALVNGKTVRDACKASGSAIAKIGDVVIQGPFAGV